MLKKGGGEKLSNFEIISKKKNFFSKIWEKNFFFVFSEIFEDFENFENRSFCLGEMGSEFDYCKSFCF